VPGISRTRLMPESLGVRWGSSVRGMWPGMNRDGAGC
jgi:hypothetical protein